MIPIELMQIVQTVAIVAGLTVMVAKVGGREQLLRSNTALLSELRDIVTDLAKTVTTLAADAKHVERQLSEIRERILRLENRERTDRKAG